jgi:TIR domain
MDFDVFISYSSKDKPAADAACAVLEANGIRCWIAPRDVIPGGEYGAAIVDAIERCRVMVLIFSSNANESAQIRREIERAVKKGVTIIPVRIEEVEPTQSMEYFLGAIHWLDALTPPFLQSKVAARAEGIKARHSNVVHIAARIVSLHGVTLFSAPWNSQARAFAKLQAMAFRPQLRFFAG